MAAWVKELNLLVLMLNDSRKRNSYTGEGGGGGEVLPYIDYIGMCRCEGYGFQAVYSRIEYINHSLSV